MADTKTRRVADLSLRNWKFLLYQDSCGGGWDTRVGEPDDIRGLVLRLEDVGVPMLVSPIHNRDLDEEGKPKKKHIHVLVAFEGKKPYSTVLSMFHDDFGVNKLEEVKSLRRDERYWCHLDTVDEVVKPKYPIEDLLPLNGYQCKYLGDREAETSLVQLHQMVEECGIVFFADLANECRTKRPDLLIVLTRYTTYFQNYLYSRERLLRMVKEENSLKSYSQITKLMSSYRFYRVKFGGCDNG